MPTNIPNVVAALQPVLTDLASNAAVIAQLVGADKQEARLTAQMGAWSEQFPHAPRTAKIEAFDSFKAEDDARVGMIAADLEDELEQLWKVMPAVEEQVMDAPTVVQAIAQKFPSYATAPVSYLSAELLDVQLAQALGPQVDGMGPRAALQAYRAALADPLAPRHAATIRLIEAKIGTGTGGFGPDPSDDQAADHLMELARLVQTTRQGRVPAELRVWRDAVAQAQKARRLVQAAGIKRQSRGEVPALVQLIQAARG